MSVPVAPLHRLLAKSADPEFLPSMIGQSARRQTALEVAGCHVAANGPRSPICSNQRTGYSEHR